MQYEIEVGGRRVQVVVTRSGGGFAVSVDGRTRQVDAARIDAHTLSLVVDSVWSNEVSIAPVGVNGELEVPVGGPPVRVPLNARRGWGRKDAGGGAASGP